MTKKFILPFWITFALFMSIAAAGNVLGLGLISWPFVVEYRTLIVILTIMIGLLFGVYGALASVQSAKAFGRSFVRLGGVFSLVGGLLLLGVSLVRLLTPADPSPDISMHRLLGSLLLNMLLMTFFLVEGLLVLYYTRRPVEH